MSDRIREIAENLRATVERAKSANTDIVWLVRFPKKCCNFVANLLLLDLLESDASRLRRMMGIVRDASGDDVDSHVWVTADDVVVDITADHFGQPKVIVEQQSNWHDSLHEIKPFLPKQDLTEGISDMDITRLRVLYEPVLGKLGPFRSEPR